MERILITGSSGFIGGRFIQKNAIRLNHKHFLCLIYDKDYVDTNKNIKLIKRLSIPYIVGDLVTRSGLKMLSGSGVNTVVHLAASINTQSSDHRANFPGTKNLLEALKPFPKNFHFIFISSFAIFSGRKNCSKPIDNLTEPLPTNEYSRTKYACERYLKLMSKKYGFKLTIVRLPTVYGKGRWKNGLFDIFSDSVKKKSLLSRINWPGLTDLIHVDDVCDLLWQKINKPSSERISVLNLASETIRISEISMQIHNYLRVGYQPIKIPNFIWNLISYSRIVIPYFELCLPSKIYSYLWRFSLVVDDVLYSDVDKVKKSFPAKKFLVFSKKVGDIFI